MTVTGKNLDQGINLSNLGCLKITELAGSKVITGLDVVDKIKAVATTITRGIISIPVTPVIINSVSQTQ